MSQNEFTKIMKHLNFKENTFWSNLLNKSIFELKGVRIFLEWELNNIIMENISPKEKKRQLKLKNFTITKQKDENYLLIELRKMFNKIKEEEKND